MLTAVAPAAAPVLSPVQADTLTSLAITARAASAEKLAAVAGATAGTLASLTALGLVKKTAAGALPPLYHITPSGAAVLAAALHTDSEGGPTMTDENTTTEVPVSDSDSAALSALADEISAAINAVESGDTVVIDDLAATGEEIVASAPAPKKTRAKKATAPAADGDVEDVTGKPNAAVVKTPKGASAEQKAMYAALCKEIKTLAGRGAKTEEKSRYLRIGNPDGKTVAYVNFPGAKHVRVCVIKSTGGGEEIVKVASDADKAKVLGFVTARVDALKTAKAAVA